MQVSVEDIKAKLGAYVAHTVGLAAPPDDHERLVERGFVASVRLLDLVGFLEDSFSVRLRPVDLTPDKLGTIAQIAEIVHKRAQSK